MVESVLMRPRRHASRPLALLLALVLTLVAAGCARPAPLAESVTTEGGSIAAKVVSGPQGARLVLVPVSINDRGPYDFILDTGASKSAVDTRLAGQLRLPTTGRVQNITGIGGTSEAVQVRVDSWRAGAVSLPSMTILSVDLSTGGGRGAEYAGLLGSDVLARFERITVDYVEPSVTLE